MRKCNKCKISYTGNINRCPLCQGKLIGEKEESPFPKIHEHKTTVLHKILLFTTISIGVIFAFLEYLIHKDFIITKYAVFGLLTIYILVIAVIKKYKNILKMMNRYFIIILILVFLWFLITKSLIITTYIIPILCIVILIFNNITMLVLKDSYIDKFLNVILLDCLIGFIPALLMFLNLVTSVILTYTCLLLDILIFIGLIIFCYDKIIEELTKKANI